MAFGDIAPTTDGGRVLAAALMIAGIGFVAILTGAVAERFLACTRQVAEAESELAACPTGRPGSLRSPGGLLDQPLACEVGAVMVR